MVSFLEKVLETKGATVNPDERNLLSVAFKNLISSKRAACRTITAIEQNPKYQRHADALSAYKAGIETALTQDCERIIAMIETKVLHDQGQSCDNPTKAFFVKMIGDYYRYICENASGEKLEQAKQKALKSYEEADGIEFPACDPIKLGLALNFSVFHYEVLKNHGRACEIADGALQGALDKIDELDEENFRDAKSIIELLKENLTLWKEEEEQDGQQIDDL